MRLSSRKRTFLHEAPHFSKFSNYQTFILSSRIPSFPKIRFVSFREWVTSPFAELFQNLLSKQLERLTDKKLLKSSRNSTAVNGTSYVRWWNLINFIGSSFSAHSFLVKSVTFSTISSLSYNVNCFCKLVNYQILQKFCKFRTFIESRKFPEKKTQFRRQSGELNKLRRKFLNLVFQY